MKDSSFYKTQTLLTGAFAYIFGTIAPSLFVWKFTHNWKTGLECFFWMFAFLSFIHFMLNPPDRFVFAVMRFLKRNNLLK